ncbi:DUF262 domain-containing protein [Methanolobus sediminis]|uniref:DUF262 domain-containing protein n=1 Tax=Methanolobus sediminis TaxID=3072978 RepID=A0AA51UKR8_9EURY|nr:DUF262 domain-containing protein [Methanolobus sediminis]WMW25374.1 DUF262 domain-containing protein [Methanolobus sediminis]
MKIDPTDQDIKQIFDRIEEGIYDLQPDFQREIVWNKQKQQKLIDSIMRQWHVPPIHLVRIEGKNKFEVLDGKQRLSAIYSFMKDEFKFDSNLVLGSEELMIIDKKYYSEFPTEMKFRFDFTRIRILEVSDIKMDEATELFLRLNLGVTVSTSEKRNCIYGPTKDFLREILQNHPALFSKETLGFSNLRMAYQDALDKIYFLEKNGSLDSKPDARALEKMYFEDVVPGEVKANLIENLDSLESILDGFKYKLTKSTLMSYYWFLREQKKGHTIDEMKMADFLKAFEEWRLEQKNILEANYMPHPYYLEFENLLSEGWIDPSSLKGRNKILNAFYKQYLDNGDFGSSV